MFPRRGFARQKVARNYFLLNVNDAGGVSRKAGPSTCKGNFWDAAGIDGRRSAPTVAPREPVVSLARSLRPPLRASPLIPAASSGKGGWMEAGAPRWSYTVQCMKRFHRKELP